MTSEALETTIAFAELVRPPCYNIPKYAHFRHSADVVRRLSTLRNLESRQLGDLGAGGYLGSERTFSVLTGAGPPRAGARIRSSLGARGRAFAPALVKDWLKRLERRRESAASAQQVLIPLATEIVGTMGVAGVKAAMDIVGLNGGRVRLPLLPLSSERHAHVVRLMQEAGQALAA